METPLVINDFLARAEVAYAERIAVVDEADQPAASLVIEADARVSSGTLVNIYNMARAAGIQQVLIAARLPAPVEVKP